jgi:GT2 family glycosyltransferase
MTTVSVVVETVTARLDWAATDLTLALEPTLAALARQTAPAFEVVVVVDPAFAGVAEDKLRRHCPAVRTVLTDSSNYFVAKNAGARAATGDIIAFLDSDAVPSRDWLATMIGAFEPAVGVVAGTTSYTGHSVTVRAMSHVSFGASASQSTAKPGFVANNVAFRRDVFQRHGFEERVPRHGGCYLLAERLRQEGVTIRLCPQARVLHGYDTPGSMLLRKQFERGADAVVVHQLDKTNALRATRWRQRHPYLTPVAVAGRRIVHDTHHLFTAREPLRWHQVPAGVGVCAVARLAAAAGELVATNAARRSSTRHRASRRS